MIVVRSITSTEYGVYAFTFSVFNIFELLTSGFSSDRSLQLLGKNSIKSNIVDQSENIGFLIRQDFITYAFGILLATAFSFLFLINNNFSVYYFFLLLLGLLMNIGYSSIKSLLISYNLVELQTRFELKCIFISLSMSTLFTIFWGIYGFLISIILYHLIKLFLGFNILNKLGLRINLIIYYIINPSKSKTDKSISVVYSILRNGIANLYNQIDILLLGILPFSPQIIAQYKVAKTLSGIPARIVYPIWAALRGRIVEAHYSQNYNRLKSLIIKPTYVFVLLFTIIYIISHFISDEVIGFLYGNEYVFAAKIFLILLTGTLILQLSNSWFNFWVIIANKSGIYIIGLIIQVIIILSSVLIPEIELIQFTGIVAFSMILGAGYQFLVFYKNYKLRY